MRNIQILVGLFLNIWVHQFNKFVDGKNMEIPIMNPNLQLTHLLNKYNQIQTL